MNLLIQKYVGNIYSRCYHPSNVAVTKWVTGWMPVAQHMCWWQWICVHTVVSALKLALKAYTKMKRQEWKQFAFSGKYKLGAQGSFNWSSSSTDWLALCQPYSGQQGKSFSRNLIVHYCILQSHWSSSPSSWWASVSLLATSKLPF